ALATGDDGATGTGGNGTFYRKVCTTLASAVGGAVVPEDGTYYLQVKAFDPGTAIDAYKLLLFVTTSNPVPVVDWSHSPETAAPLITAPSQGGFRTNTLTVPGQPDYYSVKAQGAHLL